MMTQRHWSEAIHDSNVKKEKELKRIFGDNYAFDALRCAAIKDCAVMMPTSGPIHPSTVLEMIVEIERLGMELQRAYTKEPN